MKHIKKTIGFMAFIPMVLGACAQAEKPQDEHQHNYDHANPVWTWSEDYAKATLKLDCPGCDDDLTVTVNSTVKSESSPTCTEDAQKVYQASAELDGETFTKEASVTLDKLGHEMTKHEAVEAKVQKALNEIEQLSTVTAKPCMIRIERL